MQITTLTHINSNNNKQRLAACGEGRRLSAPPPPAGLRMGQFTS